jgi:hypothetical protein
MGLHNEDLDFRIQHKWGAQSEPLQVQGVLTAANKSF